ncbi:hypothetical protein KEJ44_01745 [Candidatus Bathyarchaeota archaeon]|nr:hypothetical protein [Candidatus Bathyarchaeota archaeon]
MKAIVFIIALTLLFFVQCSAQPLAWRYSTVGSVTALSISSDGKYAAVGNKDGAIYLLDREKGTELWKYFVWEGINAISISSDGAYVAVGGNNRIVYLFDRELSGRSYIWRCPLGAAVLDVTISGDGKYLAAGSFDHRVYFFDAEKPTPLWSYQTGGSVRSIDISEDGNFLAAGSDDGYLYIFDKEYTGNKFISRFKAAGPIRSVSISSNGYFVAAGGSDSYIYFQDRMRDEDTYTWRHRLDSKVISVSISSDGEYIAAGDSSGRIYLFDKDYSNNNFLWSYPIGVKSALVSISGDGEFIASGSEEGIYLFDKNFEKNSFLWYLPVDSTVTDLEVSMDGSSIIAGDYKGYVYMFWPLIPGKSQQPIETTATISEGTLPVTSSIRQARSSRYIDFFPPVVAAALAILVLIHLRAKKRKKAIKAAPRQMFGYRPLDLLLKGGIPRGYSLILSSAPCDQRDDVIKGFLRAGLEEEATAVYISNTVDKVMELVENPRMHILICNPQADEIAPKMGNVEKVRSIENLTDVNIGIMKLLEGLYEESRRGEESKPMRICLDILDDVLIQHKGPTTRKWLLELIPRLKRMDGITLATVNPRMHRREDLNAVISIFDGQIDILEGTKRGRLYRKVLVSRMYEVDYSRKGLEIQ